MQSPAQAAAALWRPVGGADGDLDRLSFTGAEPVLPSVFPVATLAASCVGATLLAADAYAVDRGAAPRPVQVPLREAAVAFRSERYLRRDGEPFAPDWAPLSGDYASADGWVRLHCNFAHHAAAAAAALGVAPDRAAVEAAVAGRPAEDVEAAVVAAGGAAGAMRTREQWRAHPQAAVLAADPPVALAPVAPGAPRRLPLGEAPLRGVRVLDLTRVIAGPVGGRTLAALGADVLHVGAAGLPTIPTLQVETGFGKRSCHLDLRTAAGRDRLAALVAEADVFLQSFRPGALAALGFGPADLARLRPGIVAVDVSAYGTAGPWGGRCGFDSLVQMVGGIAAEGAAVAGSDRPRPLPAQALDHGSGWLAAFGAVTGLRRAAADGGSWHVRVALARTAQLLDELGRVPDGAAAPEPDVADLLARTPSPHGLLTHVVVPGRVGGQRPAWTSPPPVPGADPPAWR